MTKTKKPDLATMLATVAAMPAPRSQDEWRQASSAMRKARREAVRLNRFCEAHILCDGHHRRLRCSPRELATVYNGPSPIGDLLMIGWHRRQRVAIGDSRIADARGFARRSRDAGAILLP